MIIFIRWNMPPSRVGSTASVRPVEATPALHATLFGTERKKERYLKEVVEERYLVIYSVNIITKMVIISIFYSLKIHPLILIVL